MPETPVQQVLLSRLHDKLTGAIGLSVTVQGQIDHVRELHPHTLADEIEGLAACEELKIQQLRSALDMIEELLDQDAITP